MTEQEKLIYKATRKAVEAAMSPFVDRVGAAQRCHVNPTTFDRYVRSNINEYNPGKVKKPLFLKEEIDAFVKSGKIEKPSEDEFDELLEEVLTEDTRKHKPKN